MECPDEALFRFDLTSAAYRAGVVKGLWGYQDGSDWPFAVFWMAATQRDRSPDRYFVRLDLTGYRTKPPTGRLWDPQTRSGLDFSRYPQGAPNSRFARVFRTDWGESHRAFYHPYDRVAADSHSEWRQQLPHLIWTSDHTIVDFLEEFQSLLTSGEYVGVGG